MASNTKRKKMSYAWVILIGILVMLGFARGGITSGMGLFYTPISEDLGYGLAEIALMSSFGSIVSFFWNPIAGHLMDKVNIRTIMIVGAILEGGAFAALALCSDLLGFYGLWMVSSLGMVFCTQLIGPTMITRWFKDKKGLAMGIMMAGTFILGAILSPITTMIISNYGWRMGYVFLGVALVVIGIIVGVFILRTPEEKGELPLGAESADIVQGEATMQTAPVEELSGVVRSRALRSASFWFLFAFLFLLTGILSFASMVPSLAFEAGYDTAVSGLAMTFFLIGNAVGALVVGALADKLGPRNAVLVALLSGFVAFIALAMFRTDIAIFYAALVFFGFLSAAFGTMNPIMISTIFGTKEFSSILGVALMATCVSAMVAIPVYGLVKDVTGSFQLVLLAILVALAVCILCLFLAFKTGKKVQAEWMPKE